jgi:hypothetical protein
MIPREPRNEEQQRIHSVESIRRDDFLTNAFHSRDLFRLDLEHRYLESLCNTGGIGKGGNETAICFGSEFHGKSAALWLFLALLVSAVGGIGAGFCAQDINMGMNVGTGLLAVLSTLQGVLLLIMK